MHFVLHHAKNFLISLMYFFEVESALELSKRFNKELLSGLRAGGSKSHALLVITTCKKKIYKWKFDNRINVSPILKYKDLSTTNRNKSKVCV